MGGNKLLMQCFLAAGTVFVITGISAWGEGKGVTTLVQGLLLCAFALYEKPAQSSKVGDIDKEWIQFNEHRDHHQS